MSGGLIQLVAYSVYDIFLTQEPEITFFKIVYRRHTCFTIEQIPQHFVSKPDFGKKTSCVISKNGDLINNMNLVITLPAIPKFDESDNYLRFAWVRRIGYDIIKYIEIEIGNDVIDRHYGEWMNIWYELTIKKQKRIDMLIGDIKEITEFSDGKKSYKLTIPLNFWFCQSPGLALPILSLKDDDVKVNIEFRDFDQCSIVSPSHFVNIDRSFAHFEKDEPIINGDNNLVGRYAGHDFLTKRLYIQKLSDNTISKGVTLVGQKSGFCVETKGCEHIYNRSQALKNIKLKDAYLIVDYIYLDNEERDKFFNGKHEYLIEQLYYSGEKTVDSLNQNIKLDFVHPCKELFWVSQLALVQNKKINDHFNYTDSLVKECGDNLIRKAAILFNGYDKVSIRDIEYFSRDQIYTYYKNSAASGINCFSFAFDPLKFQPNGAANFTKIENVILKLIFKPIINSNLTKLRVYSKVYNILRISCGCSGLAYSSNTILDF